MLIRFEMRGVGRAGVETVAETGVVRTRMLESRVDSGADN